MSSGAGKGGAGRIFATAVSRHATEDRVVVFRFVQAFEPGFERARFTDRVILIWRYDSDTGMPTDAERARMHELEDLLEPIEEVAGEAVLALVSTGENLREWTYYVRSEAAFMALLNSSLRGRSGFPIGIHIGHDPTWSTYEKFRQGVQP